MDSSLIIELIAEKLQSLPDFHNLQDFIPEFYHFWHDLGRWLQEELVQSKIEQIEAKYSGAKKKKKKRYYTPLGEMVIERRAYPTSNGMKFKADEELGLRKDKWLPMVLELACALGVSSELRRCT